MKKLLSFIGIVALVFTVTACNNNSNEKKTADNQFITALGKGLEKRSDMLSSRGDDPHNEALSKAINYEIENLKPFENEEFQNPELKKLYKDYMEQLEIQKKYAIYFEDFDHMDEYDKFSNAYNERSKIIATLLDKYDLKINSSLAEEFKTNYKKVDNLEKENNSLIESLKKADFKLKDDYTLEGNVKNETGETIKNKDIKAKFIDKDGVTITTSEDYIDTDWENGEIRNIKFYLDDNRKFEKIEFTIESF